MYKKIYFYLITPISILLFILSFKEEYFVENLDLLNQSLLVPSNKIHLLPEKKSFEQTVLLQKKESTEVVNTFKKTNFTISSTSIDSYIISLISYTEPLQDDHAIQENLHCILKIDEKEFSFNLPINKNALKRIDDLFISITSNGTHEITENASLLKLLENDINYVLEIALYNDYINLSTIELGPKVSFNISEIEIDKEQKMKKPISESGLTNSKSKNLDPDNLLN